MAARYSFPGLNKSFEAVSAIFATEDLNRLDNSPDDLLACVEASSKWVMEHSEDAATEWNYLNSEKKSDHGEC